jgi:hypothetical protein
MHPGDERLPARFWKKISPDPETECWLWTAYTDPRGYGRFGVYVRGSGPKSHWAHRYAYECLVGPIPDGLVIDHLCRVKHCVNPAHLEPVTQRENIMRGKAPERAKGMAAARTHCKHGHEYTAENTGLYHSRGYRCRYCKTCSMERDAQLRRRRGMRALKGRTHCEEGHPLSGDNLYVYVHKTTGVTRRYCRACIKAKARAKAEAQARDAA